MNVRWIEDRGGYYNESCSARCDAINDPRGDAHAVKREESKINNFRTRSRELHPLDEYDQKLADQVHPIGWQNRLWLAKIGATIHPYPTFSDAVRKLGDRAQ